MSDIVTLSVLLEELKSGSLQYAPDPGTQYVIGETDDGKPVTVEMLTPTINRVEAFEALRQKQEKLLRDAQKKHFDGLTEEEQQQTRVEAMPLSASDKLTAVFPMVELVTRMLPPYDFQTVDQGLLYYNVCQRIGVDFRDASSVIMPPVERSVPGLLQLARGLQENIPGPALSGNTAAGSPTT